MARNQDYIQYLPLSGTFFTGEDVGDKAAMSKSLVRMESYACLRRAVLADYEVYFCRPDACVLSRYWPLALWWPF